MEVKPPPFDLAQIMYKNRLQEFAQKSRIPLPVYQTVNEGGAHAPQFRATVLLDGTAFTSPHTFAQRKAAEQDVARLALESMSRKIKSEGLSVIQEDTTFCKSILHEYAVKMNLDKPTYTISQEAGSLPVFISSLIFNGQTYTGHPARNKKEAEQMAARATIGSILANSETRTVMGEIISSKRKLYAVFGKNNKLHESIPLGAEQFAKPTATETFTQEAKIFKEGCTGELSNGTNGNGSSQPTCPQGGLMAAMTSRVVFSEGSLARDKINDEAKQIDPSTSAEDSPSVVLTSGRKRLDIAQNEGHEFKKPRTIEQSSVSTS